MAYRPQVLTVPNGGSGDSSFNAYLPVCGETSSTGALQQVAGQELVYNGASSLPTFQSNNANISYSNQYLNFVDDFLTCRTVSTNDTQSGLGWIIGIQNTATTQITNGTAANPGVLHFGTGSTSTGGSWIHASRGAFLLGGGAMTLTFWIAIPNLSTSSQRFNVSIGLYSSADYNSATPTNNAVWFQYSDNLNSGDWTYNTINGGTSTKNTSSVAATTAYQVMQLQINAAGTSINYLLGSTLANLSSVGTITTNIPTSTALSPYFAINKSVGTTPAAAYIDLFTLQYALTTAR